MNDETIQALIESLELFLKRVGIQTLEEAGKAIQRLADVLNQLKSFCTRERLAEQLRLVEVTPEDEIVIRAALESLPALSVAILEEALPLMRKELPAGANSGRPRSLTAVQAKAVCAYIGKLHGEGLNIRTAKQRAAQRFGVSMSTIERTWVERKKGHKPSAKEILDILKAKQANNKAALPPGQKESAPS